MQEEGNRAHLASRGGVAEERESESQTLIKASIGAPRRAREGAGEIGGGWEGEGKRRMQVGLVSGPGLRA